VLKIDGDAERVQKAVQDKLDLKRTYASVKDAHSSLLLSTAVIGFTVVTIVFAPLAFLTALFALNIDGFDLLQLKGRDGVYSSGKMSAIFGRRCVVFLLFGRDANLC
jgi:Mg2+ and Co2+ transporter CorA